MPPSDPPTPDVRQRLRELEARATPGPWEAKCFGDCRWSANGTRGEFHVVLLSCQENDEPNISLAVECRNAMPALLDRLDALESEREWRPIETMTEEFKDGRDILVFTVDGAEICYWDCGRLWNNKHARVIRPTHWMPLPSPPTETPR